MSEKSKRNKRWLSSKNVSLGSVKGTLIESIDRTGRTRSRLSDPE